MNLPNLFEQISVFLDEEDITYWLDAGVLLGKIKENRIFPYDDDIDLGVHRAEIEQKLPRLIPKANSLGYDVTVGKYKVSFRKGDELATLLIYDKNSYYYRNLIFKSPPNIFGNVLNYLFLDGLSTFHEDVYIKENKKQKVVSFFKNLMINIPKRKWIFKVLLSFSTKTGVLNYYHMTYPSYYFDNLKETTFYGRKVKIPNRVEEYLAYTYGDWKTEKKNWDKSKYLLFEEDKCIK